MAILQMNLMSETLMRTVPVNVILPIDKLYFPGMPHRAEKPYKTLYLLHGVFGNYMDWLTGTRIQRYAEENDLAVVMPSGDNAFYVDQPEGHNNYGEFIGRELVDLTRKFFPLSHKREDTFIGGLSMGGYGALRNGLKYSETFGGIVAISGALHVDEMASSTKTEGFFLETATYAESLFGDLGQLLESDKNPKWLIRKMKEDGKEFPMIYMTCGDRDSLLPVNREIDELLTKLEIPHYFEIGPGAHEWDFWDASIKKAVYQWLPTEHNGMGMNSGNVGI